VNLNIVANNSNNNNNKPVYMLNSEARGQLRTQYELKAAIKTCGQKHEKGKPID
jgi:hypothetical protein